MAQNNDGPGKRLKREQANFNKPTTQDSLDLYNQARVIENFYGSNPNYRKTEEKLFDKYLKENQTNYKDLLEESDSSNGFGLKLLTHPENVKTLNKNFKTKTTSKQLEDKFKNKGAFRTFPNLLGGGYDVYINPNVPPIYLHPSIKPQSVTQYGSILYKDAADVPKYDPLAVKPVSMLTPKERIEREKKYGKIPSPKPVQVVKRKVYENLEPMAPRQATLTSPEIVAPVVRPVPQSNLEPQDGAMGSSLRYPAQNFMNKLKARVTGTPNMPYWVDREGVKRYPSMGENTPQDVRMWEMLKSNLNPNVPEDAAELRRIDLLRKMRPKDRVDFIRSSSIAQE